jgi:hypothetical protein
MPAVVCDVISAVKEFMVRPSRCVHHDAWSGVRVGVQWWTQWYDMTCGLPIN